MTRFGWGLLVCAMASLAGPGCDELPAPKPPPAVPIPLGHRVRPSGAAEPEGAARYALLRAPGRILGAWATPTGAEVWETRYSPHGDQDPIARAGTLDGQAAQALWRDLAVAAQVDARSDFARSSPAEAEGLGTLMLRRGDELVRLTLAPRCACDSADGGVRRGCWCPAHAASAALEAAVQRAVQELPGWTTGVWRPTPRLPLDAGEAGAPAAPPPSEACYRVPGTNTLACLASPWEATARAVQAPRGESLPVFETSAWGLELENGVRCQSTAESPDTFGCSDGALLAAAAAGPTRWVAHRAPPSNFGLPGAPVPIRAVVPRAARWAAGRAPAAPDAGSFSVRVVTFEAGPDAHARRRVEVELVGGEGPTSAVRAVGGMGRAHYETTPPGVSLSQGPIPTASTEKLWAALDALDWPRLDARRLGADAREGARLDLRRGGVAVALTFDPRCECHAATAAGQRPVCPCPALEAVRAVLDAARDLPASTWSTRVAPAPDPALVVPVVDGRCEQGVCLPAGSHAWRVCFPGPRADQRYCPDDPWTQGGVVVHAKAQAAKPKPTREPRPWAVELAEGVRCVGPGTFTCSDGTELHQVRNDGDRWYAFTSTDPLEARLVPVEVVHLVP